MDGALVGAILARELRALRREVEAYPTDDLLWARPPGAPNAGGTLALHLVGNLRHFVGAALGGTGYVRDRDAEFAARGVGREELVMRIDEASEEVTRSLASLSAAALAEPYPQPVGGGLVGTGELLLHLAAHLGYHLGQVDYHRRLVTGDARGVGALPFAELPSLRTS
jgi:uncharacterized damage-inducible protein DinB